MVNVGSSVVASVKMPMALVTYPNQHKARGKKRHTDTAEQDLKKSTISVHESARRSAMDGHKHTVEIMPSSESFK